MKKKLLCMLAVLALLLPASAMADFSYNPVRGELRLSADGLYADKAYVLMIVSGSGNTSPTLSRANLIWIDRLTARSDSLEVVLTNMDLPDCTVLLSGEFRSGNSPLVLGSIDGTAYNEAYLPKALEEIDDEAFAGTSVNIVYLGDKVQKIGENAFADCRELYAIHVPESVTEIGNNAFANCPNLTIYCPYNSKIQKFAVDNNIPWEREH